MDLNDGVRKRFKTLAKSARHHTEHDSGRRSKVLKACKQAERKIAQTQQRRAELQGYTQEERDAVERMDLDAGNSNGDITAISDFPPPGEEAFDLSHEGGEYEVFEGMVEDVARATGFRRVDPRTRRDRVEIQTSHWTMQIENLVKSYLEYRKHDNGLAQASHQSENVSHLSFTIQVVDSYSRSCIEFHPLPSESFPNETLLRHGYLGCAPLHPEFAISIRTLELFRQSHRTCPRFSIQAQCKTLCHMHKVPYRPHLSIQFSNAYDAYLEICRLVDHKIDLALGFHTPESRVLRSCPACFYKLEGEPNLEFSCLVSIDGNNSLKRLGSKIMMHEDRLDSRVLVSDRWLTRDEVNRYKDEVKNMKNGLVDEAEAKDDEWEDIPDTQSGTMTCAERWRNAGPEERKKMFSLFDESGIFIACCRHRMVLVACDMIQSGELAKYPIATTNRLISMLGSKIGCAYDIGCAFQATLDHTSLRDFARSNDLRLMVGAFHGHAHNRLCQLQWHPTYIQGTGHSEGEGCEHVFSSSNDLARATRHATRFHRHQMIEEHFKFWDDDKYANLSQFLGNHYRVALDTIQTLESELHVLQEELSLTPDEFYSFLNQEKCYLESLRGPSPAASRKIQYIHALVELAQYQKEWDSARAAVNTMYTTIPPVVSQSTITTINQARRHLDSTLAKIQHAEEYVCSLEIELNLKERWTSSSPEYKEFYQQHVITDYSKALDELE